VTASGLFTHVFIEDSTYTGLSANSSTLVFAEPGVQSYTIGIRNCTQNFTPGPNNNRTYPLVLNLGNAGNVPVSNVYVYDLVAPGLDENVVLINDAQNVDSLATLALKNVDATVGSADWTGAIFMFATVTAPFVDFFLKNVSYDTGSATQFPTISPAAFNSPVELVSVFDYSEGPFVTVRDGTCP
jgi:hypothetical protein